MARQFSAISHNSNSIIGMRCNLSRAAGFCIASLASAWAWAQSATTAGSISTPYPTTQSIAIDWLISGDNNNGVVAVRYRPSGQSAWKNGMNLFRIPAGSNSTGSFGSGNGQWPNKHSGSPFDLSPATSYEIELALNDPDGGSATQTVTVSTRRLPVAPANAHTVAVTPSNLSSALGSSKPGDLLLLGPGNYPAFTVNNRGNQTQPIVIRGTSVDSVVIQGRVTMNDRQYVYLENLTIQGEVRMNGASFSVVRGCKIRTTAGGITFEIGNGIPRNNSQLGLQFPEE